MGPPIDTPWREIGYVRPKSWTYSLIIGVVFGVHYLAGNAATLPGMILVLIVVAGFGEETLLRGYMFKRLGKLLGSGWWAKIIIVLITAVWFGLMHYSVQGLPGVEQALFTGTVFGTIFAMTRRIFMLMVAHAAFDLAAVAMIYRDVESEFAHFLFK